jgi:hypothetical protein
MSARKQWVSPQVIVILRVRREEAVLRSCKGGGYMGPNNANYFCQALGCGWCDYWAQS